MAKRGGEDKRPKNFSSANGTAGDWFDNFCHNVEDWVDALWRRTGACNYLRWLSTSRSIHARDNVTIMRFLDTAALSATRDPTIPNSSSAISLKHQFHTKLDDTRIAGTRMCSHDRPESSSSNPRVGIIKIHLIENVEKLGAKLRIDAFLDFETLKKSHVKASERWTIVGSGPDLTERPDIIDRECRRVEPHSLI